MEGIDLSELIKKIELGLESEGLKTGPFQDIVRDIRFNSVGILTLEKIRDMKRCLIRISGGGERTPIMNLIGLTDALGTILSETI